jgi:vacuolar-type H+-ATPase subunit E/Vma4
MMEDRGKESLLNTIKGNAVQEAERIIRQSEEQAKQKLTTAKEEADKIIEEGLTLAERESEQRLKTAESARVMTRHRSLLRRDEEIMLRVGNALEAKFAKAVETGDYVGLLHTILLEAGISLKQKVLKIEGAEADLALLSNQLLAKVSDELSKKLGFNVALIKSTGSALSEQGLMISNEAGTLLYDGRLKTRINRYQDAVRALVYQSLATEGEN